MTAMLQITPTASTLCTFRYRNTIARNSAFEGAAFVKSWARFVGSAHRHYETGELVLFWCPEGPHPQERETLRARLEADPANIGSVLDAVDQRADSFNSRIDRANAGRA